MSNANSRRRLLVATALSVLVLGLGVAVVAGSAQAAAVSSTTAAGTNAVAQSDDVDDYQIDVTQRIEKTDEPGIVRIEYVVAEDEVVPNASITIFNSFDEVEIVDANGIEPKHYEGSSTWQMTDDPGEANVTYRMDVEASSGTYNRIEGSWAFFDHARDEWGTVDDDPRDATYSHTVELTSEGVAHEGYVGLGPHERATVAVDDATITIVHPEAFPTAGPPEDIADLLADVHGGLEAGDLEGSHVGFAHPNLDEAGYAIDDDTFIVDSPNNPYELSSTWVHEHFHIVDGVLASDDTSTGNDMTWYTEGYARYGERLSQLQRGYGSYEGSRSFFERATEYNESLAEQTDSTNSINYQKGSVVLRTIDYRIRIATDGQRDFSDVHARMADREEAIDLEDFLGIVENVSDSETLASDAREWIETTETPELWSRSEHEAAFGELPEVTANVTDVRVRNGGGEEPLDVDDPRDLSPNETIVVEYSVRNDGGVAGRFGQRMGVAHDLDPVQERYAIGSLEPGEETTATVTYHVTETGTQRVNPDGPDSFITTTTLSDVEGTTPQDLIGDGLHRDINADGAVTNTDVNVFYDNYDTPAMQEHAPAYDLTGDGVLNQSDVAALYDEV